MPYFRNEEVSGDVRSDMTIAGPLFAPKSERIRG